MPDGGFVIDSYERARAAGTTNVSQYLSGGAIGHHDEAGTGWAGVHDGSDDYYIICCGKEIHPAFVTKEFTDPVLCERLSKSGQFDLIGDTFEDAELGDSLVVYQVLWNPGEFHGSNFGRRRSHKPTVRQMGTESEAAVRTPVEVRPGLLGLVW